MLLGLIQAAALAAVAVFVCGVFVYTIINQTYDIYLKGLRDAALSFGFLWALALIILVAASVALLAACGKAMKPAAFLLIMIFISVAVYVLYGNSFVAPWISDFNRMWLAAGRLVLEGRFQAEDIIEQRALPVLVPAVYLFGYNPATIPLLNSACLIAIMLLGYDVLRRASGHLSAQIFAILWVGCAEAIYALKIPTHDLWGLVFGVLALWGLARAAQSESASYPARIVQGVLIGIPIVLLQIQRELGTVALAALAMTALLSSNAAQPLAGTLLRHLPRKELFLILAGAVLSYGAGSVLASQTGLKSSGASDAYLSNVRTAALAPGYSEGTFRYASTFRERLLRSLPEDAQKETADALLLSDFAEQPELRVSGVQTKMDRLSRLGSQTYFYQNELGKTHPRLAAFFNAYSQVYSILIAVLLLLAFPSAIGSRGNVVNLYALGFLGVLFGGLVTIGEIQPRYAFPVWFLAPVVISIWLGRLPRTVGIPSPASLKPLGILAYGAAAALAGLWIVHFVFDRVYSVARGRVVADFDIAASGVESPGFVPALRIDQVARSGSLAGVGRLGFSLVAGGSTSGPSSLVASKPVCAGAERTDLRFSYVMPYVNPKATGTFELKAVFAGTEVFSEKLPNGGEFHNVVIKDAAKPEQCGLLEFRLGINSPLTVDSWIKASRTEIYFPRFARD